MSALAGARALPMWQALRVRDFRYLWGSGPALVGMPWLAEIRFAAGPTGLGLLTASWAAVVAWLRRYAEAFDTPREAAVAPVEPLAETAA